MKLKKRLTYRTSGRCGVKERVGKGANRQKDHEREPFKIESVTMARLAALGI